MNNVLTYQEINHIIFQSNQNFRFNISPLKGEGYRKMKKLPFAFITPSVAIPAQAWKIYKTEHESQADLKVYVVDSESQADLKVHYVEYESQATEDGLWYEVEYESGADKKIYLVDYESQADLKIYIVDSESQVGWN